MIIVKNVYYKKAKSVVNEMNFYNIRQLILLNKNSSLRCLAGFDERSATTGLK